MRIGHSLGKIHPDGESFVEEIDLTHVPIEVLRSIFQPLDDDPMLIFNYNAGKDQVAALQPHVSTKLDPAHWQYQLVSFSLD